MVDDMCKLLVILIDKYLSMASNNPLQYVVRS